MNRNQKEVVNLMGATLCTVVIIVCAWALYTTGETFSLLGHFTLDQMAATENMTFPQNETAFNRAVGTFNFYSLFLGFGGILILAAIIAFSALAIDQYSEFWRLHRGKPNVEERVTALEEALKRALEKAKGS